jgi:hypothetical protein
MRNPDSLNPGEPGWKENLEHQHPNRLPTDFANDGPGPPSISARKFGSRAETMAKFGEAEPSVSDDAKTFTKLKLDWLEKIACDRALRHLDFRVAFVLSTYFNRKTGMAFPKHETLAKRIGCSRDAVRKAIHRLIKRRRYLALVEGRGRGHSNSYRIPLKGDDHPPFQSVKQGTADPEKGDGRLEKGGRPFLQNPVKNPLTNPTGQDDEGDERATAPPTGALARPPNEQAEAKRPVQEKNNGAAFAHKQLNPHADRQRFDRAIAAEIGEQYWLLPEERAVELRDGLSKGTIGPADLRAQFPNSAPAAPLTPPPGIAEQTDPPEIVNAARGKRPSDWSRTELDALYGGRRAHS